MPQETPRNVPQTLPQKLWCQGLPLIFQTMIWTIAKKIVSHFQILKGPLVLQGGSGLKSHCKICRLSDSQVFSKLHNDEQSSKLQTQHYSIISLAFFFVAGGKAINRWWLCMTVRGQQQHRLTSEQEENDY